MTGLDCGIATPDYRLPTSDYRSLTRVQVQFWPRDSLLVNQQHFAEMIVIISEGLRIWQPESLLGTLPFCCHGYPSKQTDFTTQHPLLLSLSLIFCCSANAYLAHVSSNPLPPLSVSLPLSLCSLSRFSSRMKIVHFVCRKAGAPIKIYIIPSCTFIAVS